MARPACTCLPTDRPGGRALAGQLDRPSYRLSLLEMRLRPGPSAIVVVESLGDPRLAPRALDLEGSQKESKLLPVKAAEGISTGQEY